MARKRDLPPAWDETRFGELLLQAREPAAKSALSRADNDKQYLSWDEFRRRPVPEGWTAEDLWTVARGMRIAAGAGFEGLLDKSGAPFTLVHSRPLQAILHRIDTRERLWERLLGLRRQPGSLDSESTYQVMASIEEAHGSSAIEGAVTTRREARDLIRQGRAPRNDSERMVLNNFRTLQRMSEWIESPLTPRVLLEIQTEITADTLEHSEDVGRFRKDDEVFVEDAATGEVVHRPPTWTELPERLERLCAFANAAEREASEFVHPIVRAILLHHQLAYDHPFGDGNGRTARALFLWSVLRSKYWWFRSLSISRAVNHSKQRYYRSFLDVQTDGGDATYFVRDQLRCIEQEVERLGLFLAQRQRISDWSRERLQIEAGLNARQVAIIAHVREKPDVTFTALGHEQFHGVSQATAWKDLTRLVKAGLLDEDRGAGRKIQYRPTARLKRFAAEQLGD